MHNKPTLMARPIATISALVFSLGLLAFIPLTPPQAMAAPDAKPVATTKAPAKATPAKVPAAKVPTVDAKAAAGTAGGTAAAKIPTPPKNAKEAVETGKKAVDAAKKGQWWYLSALGVLLLMFVLKMAGWLEKLGRWKYVINPVLSLVAALLAAFQGGVSLETAVAVFFTAWSTGMFEEAISHGLLGKKKASS